MFVKKLVEKATKMKPPGSHLKPQDIDIDIDVVPPHVALHYGIPAAATILASDPILNILAVATKHGQIKLLGKHNTQALLHSHDTQPTKFLQFIPNQGVLFNLMLNNKIEVWNIDSKILSSIHQFSNDITSFALMPKSSILFVGDSAGDVTIWKFNPNSYHIEKMKYCIPFSASHGKKDEDAEAEAAPVKFIMPQPMAESKRILLIFGDGLMVLWAIQESKVLSTTSGSAAKLLSREPKRATSACWVCPYGSKVAVGFNSGDILIYSVPCDSNTGVAASKLGDPCNAQITNISKLNLDYRLEKIPIVCLKWVYSSGKANRLYVFGCSDDIPSNTIQVLLLHKDNENQKSKLVLQLPEPCVDIEIIPCLNEQVNFKQGFLILLGNSGRMYAYDDQSIEDYLSQSQKKAPPSIPGEVMIRLPFIAPAITSAQFFPNYSKIIGLADEDRAALAKSFPSLFPFETKQFNSPNFAGFENIKNLYITGHSDGTIKFWDVMCSILIPVLSVTHQCEDNSTPSGIPVTAIHFSAESRILLSGDESGMVRIYQFMTEPFASELGFFSFTGNSKKGSSRVIHSVKYMKVNGPIISFNRSSGSRYLAVGCGQGHISLVDVEGPSVLYHIQLVTELSSDVISLQFESINFQGIEKNILVVATRDSSLMALDVDTGHTLSSKAVRPKKPSRALLMQILDPNKGSATEDNKLKPQLLLLCSEKAVYIYSFPHIVQGEKKVCYKKTFHSSSCCWASIISRTSGVGVMLLFSCGKAEIRSLPELSLVKEATLRCFIQSPGKPNSSPQWFLCSSSEGEVIMIRSDQEVVVASMLPQQETHRYLDSFSQVYVKNLMATTEDRPTSPSIHQKVKKKGIFGTSSKDIKGSKTFHEAGDTTADFEGLTAIFSVSNFPVLADIGENNMMDVDDIDLEIDDIDLSDHDGKAKGHNITARLDKQKLASKFQLLKGKLKQMTIKNEKALIMEEQPTEKAEAVDQIKQKYGYSSSELNVAKMVQNKLTDNVKKLQGINMKAAKMQESASSFSSMAKERLRAMEQGSAPSQT